MAIVTKLEDFNLLDILQLISMGNRSAIIRLHANSGEYILAFSHGYLTGIVPCNYDIDEDYKEFLSSSISYLIKSEIDEYNQNAQLLQILPEEYQVSVTTAIKNKFFEFLTLPQETEAEIVFRQDWDNLPLCVYPNLKSINLLLDSCKHIANKEEISKLVHENTVFEKSGRLNTSIELDNEEKNVFEAVDGQRTVKQISDKLKMNPANVINISYNLYRTGALINTSIVQSSIPEEANGLSPLENSLIKLSGHFTDNHSLSIPGFISNICSGLNELAADDPGISINKIFKTLIPIHHELEFFETTDKSINYKDFIDNLSFFNQEEGFDKNIKKAFYSVVGEIIQYYGPKISDTNKAVVEKAFSDAKNFS